MAEMIVPWLFFTGALIGAWFTYNALWPSYGGSRRSTVSFFAGWLTTELALHHIAWQALLTLGFIAAGALAAWPGKLALLLTLISWAGLAWCYRHARAAEQIVENSLVAALGSEYRAQIDPEVRVKMAPEVDWRQLLVPVPVRHPSVEKIKNITYARVTGLNLKLDIYRPRERSGPCPTLLQIHGGAWVLGSKNEQGLPLMLQMASRGWVCVSVDYRLSPHATFPDHLVDVKRAIAWIHENGKEYGADPDFIAVTGGSAGGHLAALVALTANDPKLQPGFEDVDTRVRCCVPFYGVYDFTNRHGAFRHSGLATILEKRVMKAALDEARDAYEEASPFSRVHADAPPFFVVHGDHDTLVPVDVARHFYAELKRLSQNPVAYAEMPGAQHAFEIFPSLRTTFVIHGVERFLGWVYSRYRAGAAPEAAEPVIGAEDLEVAASQS